MKKMMNVLGFALALVALGVKADWIERSDAITTEVISAYEFRPVFGGSPFLSISNTYFMSCLRFRWFLC